LSLTNEIVYNSAKKLGFDLVGFAPASKLVKESEHLSEWLKLGYNSGMSYMEKNFEKRRDVQEILPSAKSVISLALNYYKDTEYSGDPDSGKISRYAHGKDYHLVIWEKLDLLISELKSIDHTFEAVSYVDTGPVLDKAWAVRSGLGWMGKHTNVINKEIGSWFFISNIITNFEFTPSVSIEDFCGSCTACIDACPTGALDEYVINAGKCISYLTIENKGEIPEEFKGKFEGWLFGCDICQEVCPWNRKFSVISAVKEFDPLTPELKINEVEKMEQDEFKALFAESPLKRAKLKGLKRNASFIKKESN
jgi:epoxyqueuosine reductase